MIRERSPAYCETDAPPHTLPGKDSACCDTYGLTDIVISITLSVSLHHCRPEPRKAPKGEWLSLHAVAPAARLCCHALPQRRQSEPGSAQQRALRLSW